MKKEARKKKVKRRKNFFPTLLVTIFSWITLFLFVYFIDPNTFFSLPLFLFICFIALLFTSSIVLANTRLGAIVALGLTLFLFLRYLGIGNLLNFLLILGVGVSIELYFSKSWH